LAGSYSVWYSYKLNDVILKCILTCRDPRIDLFIKDFNGYGATAGTVHSPHIGQALRSVAGVA